MWSIMKLIDWTGEVWSSRHNDWKLIWKTTYPCFPLLRKEPPPVIVNSKFLSRHVFLWHCIYMTMVCSTELMSECVGVSARWYFLQHFFFSLFQHHRRLFFIHWCWTFFNNSYHWSTSSSLMKWKLFVFKPFKHQKHFLFWPILILTICRAEEAGVCWFSSVWI